MEQLLTLTLGASAFTNTTCIAGKRQDARGCSTEAAREMTALWALHPTALPWRSQLEEDKKLWFLWGQRPASHLTYTTAQMKANNPPGKTQSPSALLYPEILLCFRLSAEWGCDSPTPGCRAVAPHLQTGPVGKGGEGRQEGALWELQPPNQPVSLSNQHHKLQNVCA